MRKSRQSGSKEEKERVEWKGIKKGREKRETQMGKKRRKVMNEKDKGKMRLKKRED